MNIGLGHSNDRTTFSVMTLLIIVCALGTPAISADQSPVTAIKAGVVIPVTSPPIRGGVILIRDGKIEQVGKDVKIPDGADVIDATDKVIVPGLVDACTTLAEGGRDDEESLTPDIRAIDAFDFYGKYRRMLAGGVTTVYVSPGRRRLVSGMGAVVKLAGDSIEERSLRDLAALSVILGEPPKNPPPIYDPPIPPDPCHPILPVKRQLPTTRMAEMAVLRRVFSEARWYMGRRDADVDLKMEALRPVLQRKMPVRVNCQNSQDIRNAIAWARMYRLNLVIEGGAEAYKVIDEIGPSGAPVIVDCVYEPGRAYRSDNTRDIMLGRPNPENPRILAEAGVKFAISSRSDASASNLQFIAAHAVGHGLSSEDALKAITIAPAEILGLADRIGSIEKGKDADLVVLTGEPFDVQSVVDKTLVNGKVVYSRPATKAEQEEAEQLPVVAVRAGRIMSPGRGQISDGLIIIKGKRIDYVGRSKDIPKDATVIDASGSVVIPGLIDIHSHLGLHAETEPARVNPPAATSGSVRLVSIAKAIVPGDEAFQEVLKTGVTSVLLAPDSGGFVSGNAAMIKLAGDTQDEMIVEEYAAVKFSMISRSARMAQIWQARGFLKSAKDYAEKWDRYEQDYEQYERRRTYEVAREPNKPHDANEPPQPGRDTGFELLRGLFKRNIPALVHARRADEISNTLKVFRDEYGLDVIILGGEDGFRVIDELRQYGAGVAVGPEIMQYEKGKPINNADLLTESGLRVAFGSDATSGTQYLPMNAAYAVRNGMDEDKAFRAMTIYPAELLRVDDRIGSIDEGKDADLVILSGPPLELDSRVEKVIINGKVVYEQQ